MGRWTVTGRLFGIAALSAFAWILAPAATAGPDGEGGTPPAGGGAGKPEDRPPDKPVEGGEAAKPKQTPAPAFKLKDIEGKERALADFKGKIVVLEWINHGCPYVKRHYASGNFQALQKKYAEKGVVWLSVCSSAEGKEGFLSPKGWAEKNAEVKAVPTAVLLDPGGEVGHLYGAKVTPHMYVVDREGNLAYQGAIDDKPRPKGEEAKSAKNYVAEAVDALLAGKAPETRSTQPYG